MRQPLVVELADPLVTALAVVLVTAAGRPIEAVVAVTLATIEAVVVL